MSGFKVNVRIEGMKELKTAFNRLDEVGRRETLERAALAGAIPIVEMANQKAPGPHVIAEVIKRKKARYDVEVGIGPDKDHWYYRFFEFGVQPFEINMVTRRTTRSSGGGRNVRGEKKALAFGDNVVSVVHRGPMAAQPFLRPAFDAAKDNAVLKIGESLRMAIVRAALNSIVRVIRR